MKTFPKALTLPGLGSSRWPIFGVIVAAMLHFGWQASPYFMMYVIGEPDPGTSPRYTGPIWADGKNTRIRGDWIPPRYYVRTDRGNVEFHCDFKPSPQVCPPFLFRLSTDENYIYTIGYHKYYGLDFIKYPNQYSDLAIDGRDSASIRKWRAYALRSYHTSSVFLLGLTLVIYYCLVSHTLEVRDQWLSSRDG